MKKLLIILALFTAATTSAQTVISIGGDRQKMTYDTGTHILSLENSSPVDLSGLIGGSTVTAMSLTGTTLSITLDNDTPVTVDLSSLTSGGGSTAVEDNLISTSTTNALSANQGRVLKNQIDATSASGADPNVTVVNSLSEITSAGTGATIQIRANITLTADYTPPADQNWTFKTGSGHIDVDTYTLTGNNTGLKFADRGYLSLDVFSGTLAGTFRLLNNKIYASNLGGIDDDNPITDNFNVGVQALFLVNQNSGHLVWDNEKTGKYWATPSYKGDFVSGQSPFFPFENSGGWVVGRGHDNVTVEHEGGVEIISITNDYTSSFVYKFYNTTGSKITGGTLRGDRYRHRYNREIDVNTAASIAGNVTLTIMEPDNYVSSTILNTIVENIPVTNTTEGGNATEISNYINTNLGSQGYVAVATGSNVTFYKEGVDFKFDITAGSTGASFTETESTYEWGHGIRFSSLAEFCELSKIRLLEFHGDGFVGEGQGNGTYSIDDADMSTGFIDDSGTLDTGNSDYRYLTTPRDLPTEAPWFSFAPNSQSSADLVNFKYWMLFYDASDNFVIKSKELVPYERYYPRVYKDGRPEIAKYRVMVEYTGATDWPNFNFFINSLTKSYGAKIDQVEIGWTRRQGISNPPLDFTMTNCQIHDVGGQEPQFAIDLEDETKFARGWRIENCEFWNNANGDIITKGATHGVITGCFFKQDSWSPRNLGSGDRGEAINSGYGRYLTISNNHFEFKEVTLDASCLFEGNQMFYGDINLRPGGSLVSNNILINTNINDGARIGEPNSQGAGGNQNCIVKDNIFKWSDNWGNKRIMDDWGKIIFQNNTWFFNDLSVQHYALADSTLQQVKVNSAAKNYISSIRATAPGGVAQAWVNGDVITGLLAEDSRRTDSKWSRYCSDTKNLEVDFPLSFENGYEKSFRVRGTTSYRLEFELGEFPNDGAGTFETVYVTNAVVKVPDQIDGNEGWLNNSQYGGTQLANMLRVQEDKNVNFIFKDCLFDYGNNPDGLFMYLGNRGTNKFIDCTFQSDTPQTIDFTASGSDDTAGVYVGPNTGDISIINPTKTNVSFVLRTGDSEN